MEGLDRLEVVVSQSHGRPGVEVRMPGIGRTALQRDKPVVRAIGGIDLKFVHSFEIPPDRAFRAVDLEGHLAFRALDHAADFEGSPGAVLEFHQRPGVVFVGHRFPLASGPDGKMGAFAGRGDGPVFDDQRLLADYASDGPREHVGHVGNVGHEVAQGSATCMFPLKPPRQHAVRMARVPREEPAAVMGDVPQLAVGDETPRMLHERRPPVVVSDPGQHAGIGGRPGDFVRFAGGTAHGLLAEDMLARRGDGADHFQVQVIGHGDVDHRHLGVVDDLAPVRCSARESQHVPGLPASVCHVVRADDQIGKEFAFGESLPDLAIGAAMDHAHPSHADNADADVRSHAFRSVLLMMAAVSPGFVSTG